MKPMEFNDLDMLMTCKSIADNFAMYINDLQNAKEGWTKEYAISLENEIERAFHYYVGIETNNKVAPIRNKFNNIQAQALRAIAFLKTRIDLIYALDEKRKSEVLNLLGFDNYLKAVHEKDSSALLELLTNIEKNLSDEIKKELKKNSADQAFLDRIIAFASKIKQANDSQRSLYATKKAIAEDAQNMFNQILLKVLEISQVVTDYYKNDPEKAKLFDYSAMLVKNFPEAVRSN